jgi:hypothetical protein
MADLDASYRLRLKSELQTRKQKNRCYSVRSFARSLAVDNGYLSKLLAGKILLSLDLADKISKKLSLEGEERKQFILSAAEEQQCHALYLVDPSLTDCDEACQDTNFAPAPRSKKQQVESKC